MNSRNQAVSHQCLTSHIQHLISNLTVLPKKNRLPSYLIPRIIKKGEYLSGFCLKFVYQPNSEDRTQPAHFAIIIPRKIIKKAVSRNKIKRKISEAIKEKLPLIKKGYNIIVILQPIRQRNIFSQIGLEINTLINRLNLLSK